MALATDVNPGGGFSSSMPFAMALGCFAMGLTFEEALTAATINGAWSLDRASDVGSLEPGKLADAVLVRGDATDLLHVDRRRSPACIKRGSSSPGTMGDIMKLTQKSVAALLEDFRSSAPTPGGGSAAALAGAVGRVAAGDGGGPAEAARASDEDLQKLRQAGERCAALASELEDLVDRDSDAYELVMAPTACRKGGRGEGAARGRDSGGAEVGDRRAARRDAGVRRGSGSGPVARRLGNANARVMSRSGWSCSAPACAARRLNVEINLGSVKDSGYVEDVTARNPAAQ